MKLMTDMEIRKLKDGETDLLKDFLYEAIFIPEGAEPPEREIVEKPELWVYTDGFGTRRGDNCLVADVGGKARQRPVEQRLDLRTRDASVAGVLHLRFFHLRALSDGVSEMAKRRFKRLMATTANMLRTLRWLKKQISASSRW